MLDKVSLVYANIYMERHTGWLNGIESSLQAGSGCRQVMPLAIRPSEMYTHRTTRLIN